MSRKSERQVHTLIYPKHRLRPVDVLTFIEMTGFSDDWHDLGLTDWDLQHLQIMMMAKPTTGRVVKETGGLRKLRFTSPKWKIGKRGAVRVCYVYFEAYSVVLLVAAFGKTEKANLTPKEKEVIRNLIHREQQAFERVHDH